ncbi:hypothetical protein ACF0H5_001343 [Mactra antiquata]
MAEVKKYSGRSYAKNQAAESAASRAFDEIFAKPKPTNVKWGNASYVKPRNEGEVEGKRGKVDQDEPSDPFSFEFDTEKSPKKRQHPRLQPRTVVMQPAVRITPAQKSAAGSGKSNTSLLDDDGGNDDDLTVKKGNVRTYTKRAGRKIKEEQDLSDFTSERQNTNRKQKSNNSADPVQGSVGSSVETSDSQETSDDPDHGLYIEQDDGSSSTASSVVAQEEIFSIPDDLDKFFVRPKREPAQTVIKTDGEEITVKFRSPFLNPDIYSKFTENVKPKDPVGALSNSKVVHKNVLKHDSGTTLIVVCSPKVGGEEIKQTNTQTKYFKDNMKDIVKSKNKPVERLTRSRRAKQEPEKDPYEMEDDFEPSAPSNAESEKSLEESPIVISSATEESPSVSVTSENSSLEQNLSTVNVEAVVNKVKTAPPRKYHRIFRSRNKGFMEPQEDSPKPEESSNGESVNDSEKTVESVESSATNDTQEEVTSSQENGDSQSQEMETESEEVSTQEDNKANTPTVSENVDSDLDSSQQTNMSDSQNADNESSSQEIEEPLPKKPRFAKLPPAERKIFRARGSKSGSDGASAAKKIFSSPKKAAAVYNVRSWHAEDEMPDITNTAADRGNMSPPVPPDPPKLKPVARRQTQPAPKPGSKEMPRLTRAVHWLGYQGDDAYTSVHVSKEHKDLFTVVKNVKEAHECQEHGETQEFDDDIEYLLAGIESVEPMSTRCLSCVGLAQKCTIPAFRMHLRAHGTVTKIFSCLQDAAADPSLALCTSALMFMLSRDRLNMDLDQESLNLMLRLLGVDQQEDMATTLSPTAERALKRNKDKVAEIYEGFLRQSGTKEDSIDLECISTGNLAMESLLSLTSRRAGEWFKEELRTLGALDHIVDTVCSCIEAVGDNTNVLTNSNIENLKKVDRCLRVLENVTYLNADNQNYLISYKESCLVSSLSRALRTCQGCLSVYPLKENSSTGKVDKASFGWVLYSCILAILRVLLNLTHDNDTGCQKIGSQGPVLETVLLCILQAPQYVTIDLRFDLYVLSLGLLINLVEHSDDNRFKLLEMQTLPTYEQSDQSTKLLAYKSLVEVFCHREEAARQLEEDEPKTPEKASPNKSGEWRESDSGMEWVIDSAKKDKSTEKKKLSKPGDEDKDLDDEETFTKALHKAGKHMENSIVAAYVALLVGCLIQDNQECSTTVKASLPQQNFDGMIYMLKKFLGFMNLTSGAGSAGGKSIERVIEVLEKC